MPTKEYIDNYERANQWLKVHAPDYVNNCIYEMAALLDTQYKFLKDIHEQLQLIENNTEVKKMKITDKAFSTIKSILSDEKWSVKKVGLFLIIFAMPMGPLALALYFIVKYIRGSNET